MRSSKNSFKHSDLQVPFDSTWTLKDSLIVGNKKDTTWIKTAEKLFRNVDEINRAYLADSGGNKKISRKAVFARKFRWFNSIYRFSEVIDKTMLYGYPVKDFLNSEELNYFYSPESITSEKLKGSDSLKYRALADTLKKKTDIWSERCLISEWIGEFSNLTAGKGVPDLSKEKLKSREEEFARIAKKYDKNSDSLWNAGVILRDMIGEKNAREFQIEADTAINISIRRALVNFKDYSVRIVMPGKVIGTNGFIDKTDQLLWPVKSDFFQTEPYEMWAESKTVNTWAWVVTGIFLVFVITGLVIRLFRKKEV